VAVNGGERSRQRLNAASELTTFTYDGNGARVKKVDGSGTTYYVSGLYGKMEAGGVVTTTSYYYAAGQRVAMRTTVGMSTTVTYLHGDHPSLCSGQAWAPPA
jgi:YD repeat-containing protein